MRWMKMLTPSETGLGSYVTTGKEDFIGKKALEEKAEPKTYSYWP